MGPYAGVENWHPALVVLESDLTTPITGIAWNDPELVVRYQKQGGPVVTKSLVEADWVEGVDGAYAIRFSAAEQATEGLFLYWVGYPDADTYDGAMRLQRRVTAAEQVIEGDTPLAEARRDLALWKAALRAIASGQEYQIGTRRLRRADIAECRRMVIFYEGEVARLSGGRRRGARVMRFVPQDR
jgi:hypothetical protein